MVTMFRSTIVSIPNSLVQVVIYRILNEISLFRSESQVL